MKKFALKGLIAALAAGAALALATPSLADPPRAHARVVVRGHAPNAHIVRFHRFQPGHFSRLTVVDRGRWSNGHWWHGRHHGRIDWWWYTGGIWYRYPTAVYPHPTYVSAEAAYDYAPQGYADDSWYYCQDPEGYYPYIRSCVTEWQRVPISPQARAENSYGQPPGYEGDYNAGEGDSGDDAGDQDMESDDEGDANEY